MYVRKPAELDTGWSSFNLIDIEPAEYLWESPKRDRRKARRNKKKKKKKKKLSTSCITLQAVVEYMSEIR
jgi:hypothetical protein